MFTPQGPTLRELTRQALSSVEHGYDLLAPKFDATPFRTPDRILTAVARALEQLGPFDTGLDVCCGTGAGLPVLRSVCAGGVVGVDFSTNMLAEARRRHPTTPLVRADALALPFAPAFDLAVSFGAFGHFLPAAQRTLFAQIHTALRPGGTLAFPLPAPPPVGSRPYWTLWAFDTAMHLRNLLWRPRSSCTTAPSASRTSAPVWRKPASPSPTTPSPASAPARTAARTAGWWWRGRLVEILPSSLLATATPCSTVLPPATLQWEWTFDLLFAWSEFSRLLAKEGAG